MVFTEKAEALVCCGRKIQTTKKNGLYLTRLAHYMICNDIWRVYENWRFRDSTCCD